MTAGLAVKNRRADGSKNFEIVEAIRGALPFTEQYEYQYVAASETDKVLGAVGAVGDFIDRLVIVVTDPANSQVQIKDGGGTARTLLPNNHDQGIGAFPYNLKILSVAGPWKITTGSGVAVFAIGFFTD